MWKAPRRPNNQVTQRFDDGIVQIWSVKNTAQPGLLPAEALDMLKDSLRYEEQRLGIQRYYTGKQNQVNIERVIRVPRTNRPSSQDVAITEDGKQYRIDLVQAVTGVYPPCVDLTLARIEQRFEVPK